MSETTSAEKPQKPAKSAKSDPLPEVPPVHAAAQDILPTGPQTPLGKKPPESEQAKEAKEIRAAIGHIVDALVTPGPAGPAYAMRRMGGALFAAHIAVDLGMEKASKMTADDVRDYAANFRARFPAAWGAASGSNVMQFVRFLKLANLRGGEGDPPVEQMVVEYQQVQGALAS